MARLFVLIASLAIILLLGTLTVVAAVDDGISVLTVISAGILILMGVGVGGALATRPPDE
jgi:hypothetical protein